MQLLDWIIVLLYFITSAAIGVYYTKRAGGSVREFFLSGRNLPWWLAGTSMVATTFAADTPLAVTELVAKNGIAGNWLWWSAAIGGMFTVFFFARLWRRAGIMTDVEFVELRYSGTPAAFLRGFRALYLGVFMNCIIIGWVNLAMASILEGMFGIPKEQVLLYVALALVVTAMYSALSGLWGVAVTDLFQFVLAMAGTVVLAIVVLDLPQIGGIAGLRQQLPEWSLRMLPAISNGGSQSIGTIFSLSVSAFIAFVGVQWWASWYPGAEPGGGGYVAQRMMSARDEKHSLFATLWFTIAHYCVRPWPWILVSLASLVLYPHLGPEEKRLGYVYAMRDFLPDGLRGILVASFFAAFMSTVATQLNWGTSYLINDFYKRFVHPEADEKRLVRISRFTTVGLMVLSLLVTVFMETISGAWSFVLEAGAGLGLVLILRWFWWRVNAWSEITAMLVPFLSYAFVKYRMDIQFPETLFFIAGVTSVAWIAVTLLTPPVETSHLMAFYRRVHPGGRGWKPIAERIPDVRGDTNYGGLFLNWIFGVLLIYMVLFGMGKMILQEYLLGTACLLIGLFSAYLIYRDLSKRGFGTIVE